MATAANAKSQEQPKEPPKRRPLDRTRMIEASFVLGELMSVTFPDSDEIDEGVQDISLWANVTNRLAVGQWLTVQNDAGTFFRIMRVSKLHAAPGSGLRFLELMDLVPPRHWDMAMEPIVSTGFYFVRWLGAHRRWAVISPKGDVVREGIGTQHEAEIHCHRESGNPRPL